MSQREWCVSSYVQTYLEQINTMNIAMQVVNHLLLYSHTFIKFFKPMSYIKCTQFMRKLKKKKKKIILCIHLQGVENFGAIMIVSNWASNSIEDIAASARGAHLWMQTFIMQNRQITINIIRRAEKLDFKAIVITIDVPICNPWKFGFCQDLLDLGYDMR